MKTFSRASEVYFDGRANEDHNFQADMGGWRTIKIENYANLKYSVNDKIIYQTKYTEKLGRVRELLILGRGTFQLDYIKIYDQSGKIYYEDNFN